MASGLLAQLAATPATELPRVTADGRRLVQTIYEQSLKVGLTDDTARGDVERLYSLFDLALAHGLSSIILDYVLEVCSDPFLTSRYASEGQAALNPI